VGVYASCDVELALSLDHESVAVSDDHWKLELSDVGNVATGVGAESLRVALAVMGTV
jgi:hypothetical protein